RSRIFASSARCEEEREIASPSTESATEPTGSSLPPAWTASLRPSEWDASSFPPERVDSAPAARASWASSFRATSRSARSTSGGTVTAASATRCPRSSASDRRIARTVSRSERIPQRDIELVDSRFRLVGNRLIVDLERDLGNRMRGGSEGPDGLVVGGIGRVSGRRLILRVEALVAHERDHRRVDRALGEDVVSHFGVAAPLALSHSGGRL